MKKIKNDLIILREIRASELPFSRSVNVLHEDVLRNWRLAYKVDCKFVHTLSPYAMGELIPKMRALTGKLIEECDEKITGFVKQFIPKLPPGEHGVSLEERPKQWLVREK